jgi:hypothetical protein
LWIRSEVCRVETDRNWQKNQGRSSSGNECADSPVCRRRQCADKKENGFDLTEYDTRCLKFALDYSEHLLAIDINIKIEEMLDTGWALMRKYFEQHEVGIKDEFIRKYWKNEA